MRKFAGFLRSVPRLLSSIKVYSKETAGAQEMSVLAFCACVLWVRACSSWEKKMWQAQKTYAQEPAMPATLASLIDVFLIGNLS